MTIKDLQLKVDGSIFRVDKAIWSDVDVNGDGARSFTLRVNNVSGEWIDVMVDRSLGTVGTGHIENNQSGGFSEPLNFYFGRAIKINRWRPGESGLPGNGGGAITFFIPYEAFDVIFEIDVTC